MYKHLGTKRLLAPRVLLEDLWPIITINSIPIPSNPHIALKTTSHELNVLVLNGIAQIALDSPPLCQTGKHGWFCSIGSGWICKQRCTNTFYTQSIDASDWWHFPACKDLRLTATKCEENAWWYNLSIQVIQVMQVMQVIRGIQVMKVMQVMQAERVMWVRPAHLWVDFRV